MRKPPRRAAFRQACLRFELVDVDLADPAVLIFQSAILNAREGFAKLPHHGTDFVFAIREGDLLIGAVDLVVDLADRGNNGGGSAQATFNKGARSDFSPLDEALFDVHAEVFGDLYE